MTAAKPIIGISACLTGEAVRYDAGHKQHALLLALLAPRAQLRPFCPEVTAGLGVPRPPVQLIETSAGRVRALGVDDASLDVTEALATTAKEYCQGQLDELSGFIFKSRSPSCGLGSTPLIGKNGQRLRYSDGLFARELRNAAPGLPCVEENWLDSEERCYRFLSACLRYTRSEHERR